MNMMILRLTASGLPSGWLTPMQAACLYVREQVLWELGDTRTTLRGGVNARGERSRLAMAPIVAVTAKQADMALPLNNRLLFRRDGNRCLYCGRVMATAALTRDHVVPRCQGGADRWANVVTACRRCNGHKGGRTPEQAGMPLLAIPFAPNRYEWMFLANRHVIGDQMEYLAGRFSGKRSWMRA